MVMNLSLSEALFSWIREAAKQEGYGKPEEFAAYLLEQKRLELQEKKKVFEIIDKVRVAYEAKGISEEETLADFETFREQLYREQG